MEFPDILPRRATRHACGCRPRMWCRKTTTRTLRARTCRPQRTHMPLCPCPLFGLLWFSIVCHIAVAFPHRASRVRAKDFQLCPQAEADGSAPNGPMSLHKILAPGPGRLLARGKLLDFIIYQCGHEERTSFAKSNRHILSRTSVPNLSHCFLWVSLCTWLAPVFERSTCD